MSGTAPGTGATAPTGGLFGIGRHELAARMRAARGAVRELDEVSARDRAAGLDETPEYRAANQKVNDALEQIPEGLGLRSQIFYR